VIASGVIPVIVFDGQSLPQKSATIAKRRAERSEAREKALQLEARGLHNEALSFFQKAVEITSETVFTWITELKKAGVEYIVAPYEADAELAFLARKGYVDCVLTEDSDLLVYQTPITLFKFDDSGNVVCVAFKDVLEHLQLTTDQFIAVCCMAGCDYMEHINRVGIQTALKLIKTSGTGHQLITDLRKMGKYNVPIQYEDQLARAMLTFKAQRVYDPVNKALVTIEPIDISGDFLGPEMPPDILMDLVAGELDTRTLKRLRPEKPTGSVSPYFKTKERGDPSPYFRQLRRSKSGSKTPDPSFTRMTSYFEVARSKS
jgi:exonuclease-1